MTLLCAKAVDCESASSESARDPPERGGSPLRGKVGVPGFLSAANPLAPPAGTVSGYYSNVSCSSTIES
jgi:hypothetical protein